MTMRLLLVAAACLLLSCDAVYGQKPIEKEPQQQPIEKEPQQQPIEKEPQQQPIEKEPQQQPIEKEPQQQPIEKELLGNQLTFEDLHPKGVSWLSILPIVVAVLAVLWRGYLSILPVLQRYTEPPTEASLHLSSDTSSSQRVDNSSRGWLQILTRGAAKAEWLWYLVGGPPNCPMPTTATRLEASATTRGAHNNFPESVAGGISDQHTDCICCQRAKKRLVVPEEFRW